VLTGLSFIKPLIEGIGALIDEVKFMNSLNALGAALHSDAARYAPLTSSGLSNSTSDAL
jgi:hypothetical protein